MKTAKQMFGKVAHDLGAAERERKEMFERIERDQAEADARLDSPLTRREVIDALETVASEYSGQHGHDTRELIERLRDALK